MTSQAGIPQKSLLKFTSFSVLKENAGSWSSPPFYSFPGGYKMLLNVYPGGTGGGEGTHVSLFLHLLAGENDHHLQWPPTGEFFIEILNQGSDKHHHGYLVTFTAADALHTLPSGSTQSGYGIQKFISHKRLVERNELLHIHYLRNDSIYFRVAMTVYKPSSKPWLSNVRP